jgi:MATE family multidrug resistance protein
LTTELRPLLKLAGPVVLAEIGWMSMGIVDTLMVGPLGPAAIAATGMGSSVFTAIAIFGMGLMLGLDALVSQSYGAKRIDECLHWLHQGVILAVVLAPPAMSVAWLVYTSIDWWGLHPDVRALVGPYLRVISLGALPLFLYAAFRRYLQGLHIVRPIMAALITANVINAVGNWIFIHGNLGAPALGVEGSAWATTIARVYMAAFLFVTIRHVHHQRGAEHPHADFRADAARLRRLVRLGAPAASQITLEVGAFATVTTLAGRLDPTSSAANQIALNIASLAFMVPLGLGSASAVRVGHAIGARDRARAVTAGWTALAIGAAAMAAVAVSLFVWPQQMMRAFTEDDRVVEIGIGLLAIAAAFQLFDGTQAVATGVLRGLGDTRTPMVTNIVGYWVFGLPIGYALTFTFGWGVAGLWVGLSIGLVTVAVALIGTWAYRARALLGGRG